MGFQRYPDKHLYQTKIIQASRPVLFLYFADGITALDNPDAVCREAKCLVGLCDDGFNDGPAGYLVDRQSAAYWGID